MAYAGYWRRISASLIDCILLSIAFTALFMVAKSWIGYFFTFSKVQAETEAISTIVIYVLTAIGLCIDMCFFVLMPKWLGGTPGQFFMGIRLAMRDSTKPSLNAIMLKHCMSFILLTVVMLYFWTYVLVPLEDSESEIRKYVALCCYGWLFLNLFVMACNKNHRSLSDYISDMAVVDKASIKDGYVYVYVDEVLNAVPEKFLAPVDDTASEKIKNSDGKDEKNEDKDKDNEESP